VAEVLITAEQIESALRELAFNRSKVTNHPLFSLEVVDKRLPKSQSQVSPKECWHALADVLRSLIIRELPELQAAASSDDEKKIDILSDSWSHDQQALRATFLWCLNEPRFIQDAIAVRMGLTERTVERRLREVHQRLADLLKDHEQEAQHSLEARALNTNVLSRVDEDEPFWNPTEGRDADAPPLVNAALAVLHNAILRSAELPRLTPKELAAIGEHQPTTTTEYLLQLVASRQNRPQFDQRFVQLSLWLDTEGEPGLTPPVESGQTFTSLETAMATLDAKLLVVTGEPGCGKTTLLDHLELETAVETLRGRQHRIPFLISLRNFPQTLRPDKQSLDTWIRNQWSSHFRRLPELDRILTGGRLLLLLDGLNEIPRHGMGSYNDYVREWRRFSERIFAEHPGNRVVFTCRRLDYTTALSTPLRPVPRLEIKPLDDARLQLFLETLLPAHAKEVWTRIESKPIADVLRTPYYLRLFAEHFALKSVFPEGLTGVFANFIRRSIYKEHDRGNPLMKPGVVLSKRDIERISRATKWRVEWEIPDEGPLVPDLSTLAEAMYVGSQKQGTDDMGLTYRRVKELLDDERAPDIIDAGQTLGLLVDHPDIDAVSFSHLQMRAFFLARILAKSPQPDRVALEWIAEHVKPSVSELLAEIHPAEPLSPLNQTGWEEPTMLAVEMTAEPAQAIEALAMHNLSLAGRCAAIPAIRRRLTNPFVRRLGDQLILRSRDRQADLRHRIDCARAVGDLGDPRFNLEEGPHGPYLLPPIVSVQGGTYPIGDDDAITIPEVVLTGHQPRHPVKIAPFAIGKFPLTNAEFEYFVQSGYDDKRWWDSRVARCWRRGRGVAAALRFSFLDAIEYYRNRVAAIKETLEAGEIDEDDHAELRLYHAMTEDELKEELERMYPDKGRAVEPLHWNNGLYNHPSQPVVGITWYEARAYCNWLSAQSGLPFRLPTEVEWEAAARGKSARLYAYGDQYNVFAGNTVEMHLRAPNPIGVFPEGDTPEGICEMGGNVWEWTSSAWGEHSQDPAFAYPYKSNDGREEHDSSPRLRRVVRGGCTFTTACTTRTAFRGVTLPGLRSVRNGMRLAFSVQA
jgi:formylglycine-generating enzyme required for sulfatase activity